MTLTGENPEVFGEKKTTPSVNVSTANLTRTAPGSKPNFRTEKAVTNSSGHLREKVTCFL